LDRLLVTALAYQQQVRILQSAFRCGGRHCRHGVEPVHSHNAQRLLIIGMQAAIAADPRRRVRRGNVGPAVTDEVARSATIGKTHHFAVEQRRDDVAPRQQRRSCVFAVHWPPCAIPAPSHVFVITRRRHSRAS